MNYASFTYTPDELGESMTSTVHDTLNFLARNGYLTNEDRDALIATLAVYPMPNRKGYGRKILDRFFGKDSEESNTWVFPIVVIDAYNVGGKGGTKKDKPDLNVVSIKKKDHKDEV